LKAHYIPSLCTSSWSLSMRGWFDLMVVSTPVLRGVSSLLSILARFRDETPRRVSCTFRIGKRLWPNKRGRITPALNRLDRSKRNEESFWSFLFLTPAIIVWIGRKGKKKVYVPFCFILFYLNLFLLFSLYKFLNKVMVSIFTTNFRSNFFIGKAIIVGVMLACHTKGKYIIIFLNRNFLNRNVIWNWFLIFWKLILTFS
jgi:hypothetical protein